MSNHPFPITRDIIEATLFPASLSATLFTVAALLPDDGIMMIIKLLMNSAAVASTAMALVIAVCAPISLAIKSRKDKRPTQ